MFKPKEASPSSAAPAAQSLSEKYSIFELNKIYELLKSNKVITRQNYTNVIESLRILAEMVIYGDSKSQLLFDFFCEKNIMMIFLAILKTPIKNQYKDKELLLARFSMRTDEEKEKERQDDNQDEISIEIMIEVYIQILQTLSILISCVKNDTSLYYLLSNNVINSIISFSFLENPSDSNPSSTDSSRSPSPSIIDTSSNVSPPISFATSSLNLNHLKHINNYPEALLSHYASFLKTLSLRLDEHTIQFFFNESTGEYPLLVIALTLLENTENMVKISAQTVILNIYRVSTQINFNYNKETQSDLNFLSSSPSDPLPEDEQDDEDLESEEIIDETSDIIEETEKNKEKIKNNTHLFICSASEYAVQEWVLHMMMKIFVRVMMDYFAQLQVLSIEYFNISVKVENKRNKLRNNEIIESKELENNEDDLISLEEELAKYEGELIIMRNNMEDWLYFINDLLLMNNKKLSNAIIIYLYSNFICLILLDSLVNSYLCLERYENSLSKSQTGDDSEDVKVLGNETQRKLEHNTAISHISCSTYYLFIIIRILNNPNLNLAVLNSLTHPLQRSNHVFLLNLLDEKERDDDDSSAASSPISTPTSPHNNSASFSSSNLPFKFDWKNNMYRKAFLFFLNFPNVKINYLSFLIIHTLTSTFCDSNYLNEFVDYLNQKKIDLIHDEKKKRKERTRQYNNMINLHDLFQSTFLISNKSSSLSSSVTPLTTSLISSSSHHSINSSEENNDIIIIGRQKKQIKLKKELSKTVFNSNLINLNQYIRTHHSYILYYLNDKNKSEDNFTCENRLQLLSGYLEQLTEFLLLPIKKYFDPSTSNAQLPSITSLQLYSMINFNMTKSFFNTLLYVKNNSSIFNSSNYFIAPFQKLSINNFKREYYFLSDTFCATTLSLQNCLNVISSQLIDIVKMIGNKLIFGSMNNSTSTSSDSNSTSSTSLIVTNIITLLLNVSEEAYKYNNSKPKVWYSSLTNSQNLIFPSLSNNFSNNFDEMIQRYDTEYNLIKNFYKNKIEFNELTFVSYSSIHYIFLFLINSFFLLKNIYVKYEKISLFTTKIFEKEKKEKEKKDKKLSSPSKDNKEEEYQEIKSNNEIYDSTRITDFFKNINSPQEISLCHIDELGMIPAYYQYDSIVAMKGRKFLDIQLVSSKKVEPETSSNSTSSWFSYMMNNSNSKRPQSMGILGSANVNNNKRLSLNFSSSSNSSSSIVETRLKLLFLQDSSNLILVGQKKVDGKIIFKVLFSTSLLFCSASLVPNDKKSCRLTILTFLNSNQMNASLLYQYGNLINENYIISSSISNPLPLFSSCHPSFDDLQPPTRSMKQFEIILQFETPQAAALATVHIESKKKSISMNFLNNTILSLEKWKDLTSSETNSLEDTD